MELWKEIISKLYSNISGTELTWREDFSLVEQKAFLLLTCHQSSLMEKKPFREQASGKSFLYNIKFFQVHPLILSRSPADVSVPLK